MTKTYIFSIALFSLTILLSCKNDTIAKFEIVNTTKERIDSFHILPANSKDNFIQVEPNEKISYDINMTDVPKVDGNYQLSFKSKTKAVFIPFGYYSNGYPMESITRIIIHPDTVLIKPEYKDNY
ncbi:MAG: hypothetical protein IPH34_13270 [Chitinophagaceae bacterium]|nr:hypothetical protein [Chitinophagaceae bacterium]MBK8606205.1 hypothetical protein [Chitinophagaceae bacterium]MBP6478304.1 hypothetical protein [Chitinophagaceae bacterium]MBP7109727.1 hypothetical protein [Chitinophagaceae bacterium]MBP7316019.1 hypothetical protein [Chitinophagaceae bacterium]